MTGNVQEEPRVFPDPAVLLHRHLDDLTAGSVSALADERHPILHLHSFRGFADPLIRVPKDRVVSRDPFRTQASRAVVCPALLHLKTRCLAAHLVCPRISWSTLSSEPSGQDALVYAWTLDSLHARSGA
jgi:hypothetical protein